MPPSDLLWGLIFLLLATLLVFAGSIRISWERNRKVALLASVALALFLIWFSVWGRDQSWLATILPFSNLVIVGNWLPPGLAGLAGIAWRTSPGCKVRRSIPAIALACLALYSAIQPLLGEPPRCQDRWQGVVCLQTSDSTCSAACAATLLKHYGIHTTESEMVDLCLTRKGTTWLGMFRGLTLKTVERGLRVKIFDGNIDRLREIREPMLIDVGLPSIGQFPKIYTEDYGWQPGVLHSVVFYGFKSPDRIWIGEPTPGVGREEWSLADLQVLYRGRGFRLLKD